MKIRFALLALLLCICTSATFADLKKDIEFAKPNGISLKLDAYVPDGKGPFPTIIIVHGGGFNKGDQRSFVPPLFPVLTEAGFAWFTIDYRLYPNANFPDNAYDVETAIRWIKAHANEYNVDLKKLVLMGESAGGTLVSYDAVRAKSDTRVTAVVVFYGVHDWAMRREDEIAGRVAPSVWRDVYKIPKEGDPTQAKVLQDVSAITHIKKGLPPFLLIHGTDDKQVSYQQSVQFQKKMNAIGNRCELITVEGGQHGMGVINNFPDTKVKMIAWLKKALKIQ